MSRQWRRGGGGEDMPQGEELGQERMRRRGRGGGEGALTEL